MHQATESAMMSTSRGRSSEDLLDDAAISHLKNYLRIPTVHPKVDYDECVKFLNVQARSIECEFKVHEIVKTKPIVIITWRGKEPSKPAILLNSHMDVVPVYGCKWTYNPFGAEEDKEGDIYARGAQDMKSVGMQYLEAIRRLKLKGVFNERTVHVSFVPDEEIGGIDGMKKFVHTDEFKELNIGFALDEGVACPDNHFLLFYNERCIWEVNIECAGTPGHGSLLLDQTAGEKLRIVIDRFMDYRAKEKAKLKSNSMIDLGNVTTINLTMIGGGVQANVVPPMLTAVFDIRLDNSVDHTEFEQLIKSWCEEAGPDVTYSFKQKNPKVPSTPLDETNRFWLCFKRACEELGLEVHAGIFPGATDSRYLRGVGIPAIGFSPINNTPVRLHDHNEFINRKTYLRGVEIYMKIIPALAERLALV